MTELDSAPRLARVGDRVEETRAFTQADFDRFAAISGDDNPIHVDAALAARTHFGRTVSHGMLLYAVLAGIMRRHGLIATPVGQDLIFPNPAFAGEPIRFSVAVTAAAGDELVLIQRAERVADTLVVCEGRARFRLAAAEEGAP